MILSHAQYFRKFSFLWNFVCFCLSTQALVDTDRFLRRWTEKRGGTIRWWCWTYERCRPVAINDIIPTLNCRIMNECSCEMLLVLRFLSEMMLPIWLTPWGGGSPGSNEEPIYSRSPLFVAFPKRGSTFKGMCPPDVSLTIWRIIGDRGIPISIWINRG